MQSFLLIFSSACLFALSSGAITATESKLVTKLAPVNSVPYEDTTKDLTAAASDRTSLIPAFHIGKDYGQPSYGSSVPYGSYYSSIYSPSVGYRGAGLNPGYLNVGYNRGYGPNGVTGGGHLGYGYYGNLGYNPGYGSSGYIGNSGYGGYGSGLGYGSGYGSYNTGNYGLGYDDGYNGYGRGGYGRYGGYDGYGYGSGYAGYGGSNYGSAYAARSNYEPYSYQGYGSYGSPSGYRGYS
ncbi:uncharacterized protein LOC117225755 isoform X1 [Megalopta genalis]|uniref:uncharacterized protein LOC117225755 isoform X1 n=1 Tax=Megalopta genalis TaxID=115081 RepID=UPI003FD69BF4